LTPRPAESGRRRDAHFSGEEVSNSFAGIRISEADSSKEEHMPQFVLSYRSPKGQIPSPEIAGAWMAWFDSMGDHVVDIGKPVFERTSLGDCDSNGTDLGGYSILVADDIEEALALAKGCPHLDRGGGVEIGQLGEVPALRQPSA
jgi:hypothetical protein